MAQTARFELFVDPDSKVEIEKAAAVTGESASDFARHAAVERAQAVLRQPHFDTLMAEFDAPAQSNERVRAAVRRLDEVVKKR